MINQNLKAISTIISSIKTFTYYSNYNKNIARRESVA